ncbi:MAG: glycosyltransferase [Blautia sp.]|nr:glycosyltransferase [Lachnoclostridium sp.]MCM1210216.1 glycosyltransferase [Blautia sp.]
MKILFLYSKIQTVVGIVRALSKLGHEVEVYPCAAEELETEEEMQKLRVFLEKKRVDFVISNAGTPAVGRLTYEMEIRYAVYGMDSPMYETYLPSFQQYDNCYFFYFDYREYLSAKQKGYPHVFYLPLAGDLEAAGKITVTDADVRKYGCEMSFVGALYSGNAYDGFIGRFPLKMQQSFSDMLEQSAFCWDGQDRLGRFLTPGLAAYLYQTCPEVYNAPYELPLEYYFKEIFFARKLTHIERTLLMGLLAERYDFRLYTRDNEQVPAGVPSFGEVDPQTEAYKVFHASKINLNITMRSIESGVPLRVFDIMSIGGFVLSNYQEEIPKLFEEDKEIVTFRSPEELVEKADYYLTHEEERSHIARNGCQKIKQCYTYEKQVEKIISILYSAP